MPSPFPGMDPYIERPAIWPDFHDRLIAAIVGVLQPLLRPRFAAVTQDRLYLVESERSVYPDVAVVKTPRSNRRDDAGGAAVLEVDAPVVFELDEDEIREPFIEIVEPSSGRIVTAIEVISPTNKDRSDGQDAYETKREEYWDGGANIVEIDLLRAGGSIVKVAKYKLDRLRPWDMSWRSADGCQDGRKFTPFRWSAGCLACRFRCFAKSPMWCWIYKPRSIGVGTRDHIPACPDMTNRRRGIYPPSESSGVGSGCGMRDI